MMIDLHLSASDSFLFVYREDGSEKTVSYHFCCRYMRAVRDWHDDFIDPGCPILASYPSILKNHEKTRLGLSDAPDYLHLPVVLPNAPRQVPGALRLVYRAGDFDRFDVIYHDETKPRVTFRDGSRSRFHPFTVAEVRPLAANDGVRAGESPSRLPAPGCKRVPNCMGLLCCRNKHTTAPRNIWPLLLSEMPSLASHNRLSLKSPGLASPTFQVQNKSARLTFTQRQPRLYSDAVR